MASDEPVGTPEPLVLAAQLVADCFDKFGVQYALIGGVATGIRSQIRATEGLDFLAAISQITLAALAQPPRGTWNFDRSAGRYPSLDH